MQRPKYGSSPIIVASSHEEDHGLRPTEIAIWVVRGVGGYLRLPGDQARGEMRVPVAGLSEHERGGILEPRLAGPGVGPGERGHVLAAACSSPVTAACWARALAPTMRGHRSASCSGSKEPSGRWEASSRSRT